MRHCVTINLPYDVTTQEEEVHILVYRGSLVRTSVAGKHCDALCQVHGKSVTVF